MGIDPQIKIREMGAECDCGFSPRGMPFGTNEEISTSTYYSPFLCNKCGELFSTNILENQPVCTSCFFNDIEIYGTPSMLGDPIALDIDSENFQFAYDLENTFHELEYEDKNVIPLPLGVAFFRKQYIEEFNKFKEETPSPILTHYNYCPRCEQYRLEFFLFYNSYNLNELP